MPLPFAFDFKNPDYREVFLWRLERLNRIRENPIVLNGLNTYYRDNPAQFIIDWGVTLDPRNIETGMPAVIPFILFPRQEEYVHWFMERWKTRTSGVVAKSREMGLSWLSIGISCTLCLFNDGIIAGFGSRKEEYVDKIGKPGSLLDKARFFLRYIPKEFSHGWSAKNNGAYMRISFPHNDSLIIGEAGDNMGRGDRTSFYNVDEAAWLQHPEAVDAALSQTTNCRIHISTPHGPANPFAQKWFSDKIPKFSFHWREDPRKDQAWYDRQCEMILDPVIIAQEIDLNFAASMEGVIIPSEWVQAVIDAHLKLKIDVTGARYGCLDIADRGRDANAFCGVHGVLLNNMKSWFGKEIDIFKTVEKSFDLCDEFGYPMFKYDADGLGAGARGDARVINERRDLQGIRQIEVEEFHGSGAVMDPKLEVFSSSAGYTFDKGVTNEDYFENFKAQAWLDFRKRFLMTYRAVTLGTAYDPAGIISISSELPELSKLMLELSQPTLSKGKSGKMVVNKTPDGSLSPNLADAAMMAYARSKKSVTFFDVPL